jgi:hypothetical protein
MLVSYKVVVKLQRKSKWEEKMGWICQERVERELREGVGREGVGRVEKETDRKEKCGKRVR